MHNYSHDAPCPKCGQKIISNSFVAEGKRIDLSIGGSLRKAEHDLIARYCRNCGYRWEELPVDIESGLAGRGE